MIEIAVYNQIKGFAEAAIEATRRKILIALSRLVAALESPTDVIHRYGHMNLQTAAIRIGIDLKIFKLLSESSRPVSVETITKNNPEADYQLINRVLRYLAAIDTVKQVSASHYAANRRTRNLSDKTVEAGLGHFLNTVAPQYEALPAWCKKTHYQMPVDEVHTAFQDAWNTPLDAFAWFADNLDHLAYFNDYMALRRQPEATWLSVFPVLRNVKGWDSEGGTKAVYVNVGGGIGHQCKDFKEKYPSVPGRVILQDLPHSIANALDIPGVENMELDFFQPQPVKNAKFYYMRGILHDHSPQRGRIILEQTKEAMGQDSILLIDEMILPEKGVNHVAASIDMTMLVALGGLERTEAQWRETLEDVGLELVQTYIYAPTVYEGVMHVRKRV